MPRLHAMTRSYFLATGLLATAVVLPRTTHAEEQLKPLHHLVYDDIDHIFYCLGSAIDCDWISVP